RSVEGRRESPAGTGRGARLSGRVQQAVPVGQVSRQEVINMSGKHKAGIAAITGALLLAAFGLHLAGLQGLKNDLLVLSTIVAGIPISMKAFQALRQRAFSIELLVTIAVVGARLIGEY